MSDQCPCEEMDSEDPLFIIYSNDKYGKPLGITHTQAGYLVYSS